MSTWTSTLTRRCLFLPSRFATRARTGNHQNSRESRGMEVNVAGFPWGWKQNVAGLLGNEKNVPYSRIPKYSPVNVWFVLELRTHPSCTFDDDQCNVYPCGQKNRKNCSLSRPNCNNSVSVDNRTVTGSLAPRLLAIILLGLHVA